MKDNQHLHDPGQPGENAGFADDALNNPGRRELLETLGKVGVFTPPAMLSLLLSQKASASSLPSGPPGIP